MEQVSARKRIDRQNNHIPEIKQAHLLMTDKADNPLKESLSALLDGEASELELRRILKSGDDSEAREVWQRYQMASALLRGDCSSPKDALEAKTFSAGVLAALDAENQGLQNQEKSNAGVSTAVTPNGAFSAVAINAWYGGLGKVAIAASVTLAMLLGVSQFSLNEASGVNSTGSMAAADTSAAHPGDTSAVVPEGYSVPSLSAMTVSSVPGVPASRYNSNNTRSLTLPASTSQGRVVEYSPELQAQLQRMLILHSEKATAEVGLTIVPISRLSSQDIPKE